MQHSGCSAARVRTGRDSSGVQRHGALQGLTGQPDGALPEQAVAQRPWPVVGARLWVCLRIGGGPVRGRHPRGPCRPAGPSVDDKSPAAGAPAVRCGAGCADRHVPRARRWRSSGAPAWVTRVPINCSASKRRWRISRCALRSKSWSTPAHRLPRLQRPGGGTGRAIQGPVHRVRSQRSAEFMPLRCCRQWRPDWPPGLWWAECPVWPQGRTSWRKNFRGNRVLRSQSLYALLRQKTL